MLPLTNRLAVDTAFKMGLQFEKDAKIGLYIACLIAAAVRNNTSYPSTVEILKEAEEMNDSFLTVIRGGKLDMLRETAAELLQGKPPTNPSFLQFIKENRS